MARKDFKAVLCLEFGWDGVYRGVVGRWHVCVLGDKRGVVACVLRGQIPRLIQTNHPAEVPS